MPLPTKSEASIEFQMAQDLSQLLALCHYGKISAICSASMTLFISPDHTPRIFPSVSMKIGEGQPLYVVALSYFQRAVQDDFKLRRAIGLIGRRTLA